MNSKTTILLFAAISAALVVGVWFYSFTFIQEKFHERQNDRVASLALLFTAMVLDFRFSNSVDRSGGVDWFLGEYRKTENDGMEGGYKYETEYSDNVFLKRAADKVFNIAQHYKEAKGAFVIDNKGFIPWAKGVFSNSKIVSNNLIFEIAYNIQNKTLKNQNKNSSYAVSQVYKDGVAWGFFVMEVDCKAMKALRHKVLSWALTVILIASIGLSYIWKYIKNIILQQAGVRR